MLVTDWQQWCAQHHIKLKGTDSHDDKENAGSDHRRLRRTGMAHESAGHEGKSSGRNIQKHA